MSRVAKGDQARDAFVICANGDFVYALVELLAIDGFVVTPNPGPGADDPAVVIANCDSWPRGWNLATLHARFRRVPCILLSGSPLGGDFAATSFHRGYFTQLPAAPNLLLALVDELSRG